MKTLPKTLFALMAVVVFMTAAQSTFAQKSAKPSNMQTIQITTSAVCDMCKERIEKALSFEKGVKSAKLDVNTKIVTVEYDDKKTNADNLKKAISNAGYDADDVKANNEAYANLPNCCKGKKGCKH
jgi:copper chaperone CopZ